MNVFIKAELIAPMIKMVSPTSAQSFMVAARALFSGVEALSTLPTAHPMACSFLAAQSLECLLKSYLAQIGTTQDTLSKKPYGHNLEYLWRTASLSGLDVQLEPPQWCKTLNSGHSAPYRFRYPMKLHGFGLPASIPMTSDLKVIMQLVEKIVN